MKLDAHERAPHQPVDEHREQLTEEHRPDVGHRGGAKAREREWDVNDVDHHERRGDPPRVQHDRDAGDLDDQHHREELAAAVVLRHQRAAGRKRPHDRERDVRVGLGNSPSPQPGDQQADGDDGDRVVGEHRQVQRDPRRLAREQRGDRTEEDKWRQRPCPLQRDARELLTDRG
ncbi:MAG: hypothetical protein M3619_26555 [Myxococcota bacterium]|nr:hypothetical protein [Myxococcota bacterium]